MSSSNASIGRLQGASGRVTRRVLAALERPARTPDLVAELGLPLEVVWGAVKGMHERGWVERVSRGVYRATDAGRAALAPRDVSQTRYVRSGAPTPPAGEGWTPGRRAWLARYYARLGPARCAELLEMKTPTVHAMATRHGLRFGEVDGYQLITDLAALLERDYVLLYTRAKRAGVLTFPGTVAGKQRRAKALVPDWWVEQIADEIQPPAEGDVALAALRVTLGLSKTQMARRAGADARLRTLPGAGPKGQQAQLYVSAEVAARLGAEQRARRQRPRGAIVGRAGVLAAIAAAGADGRSERELTEALPCSRAAVRLYVRALLRDGETVRCRSGTSADPFVYREARHALAPEPAQRQVIIPGRPALPQAAD